jgi:hypothetical protein
VRSALAALVAVVLCAPVLFADEEAQYWPQIKELREKSTPSGNPELIKHLRSLTKDQMLTALRQLGKEMEAEVPPEQWKGPYGVTAVMMIMRYYPDPCPQSAFSDEQVRHMKDDVRREFEAGTLPGPLSDGDFDKLVALIADKKEQTFARYALLAHYLLNSDAVPPPTSAQRERLLNVCFALLRDNQAPAALRCASVDAAWSILDEGYRHVIYSDAAVKEMRADATGDRWRNLDAILDSGEIKLAPGTMKELGPWRRSVQDFRSTLIALQEDDRQPESLGSEAKRHVSFIDRLPLIRVNEEDE